MRKSLNVTILAALVAAVCLPTAARATNGYFQSGFGTDSKAMAGAGAALALSSLAPATNPAGIAFTGSRLDATIALFSPSRDYTVTGAPSGNPMAFGLAPGTVRSDSRYFPVPSLSYSHALDEVQSVGLAFYGNGGMNTDYPQPTFHAGPTGVDLTQMFLGLTYARKLNESHAVGLTPILAYQRFKATGLGMFAGYSSDPANLTDEGYAGSWGGGVRVGYLGRWTPQLALGASYQSRTWMTPFDKYKGLYAEQGDFDIPSNWVVGAALTPHPAVDFVVDVQQIRYSEVKSVGNPMMPNLTTAKLGDDAGAGFGWQDMTIVKGGVQWRGPQGWTLRAGYSYGQQPIPEKEVMFNILAPGVIEQHISGGFSKTLPGGHEVHLAVTHAISKEVKGANPLELPGQQEIALRMDQWDVEVGYSFGWGR